MFTLAPISPARAGFLEELFGVEDAPQAAPPPRARPARKNPGAGFSIRLNEGRKAARATPRDADGDRHEYVAGSRPEKPRLCALSNRTERQAGHAGEYLRDETLRSGDSVVTDGDIIVFKGNSACPHTAGDFVPLARSTLPRAQRNALADLERAMRTPARRFDADRQTTAKIIGQVNDAR